MAVALGYLQAVLNKLETTDEGGFSRCDSLKLWQGIWVSKVFKDNGGVLLEMGPRSRENDYIIQSMSCQQGIFFFFQIEQVKEGGQMGGEEWEREDGGDSG